MNPTLTAGLGGLNDRIHGRVIRPGDPDYDALRSIWNAMVDRRPAAIVRCTCVEDVREAIRTARELDLEIAVRGGGHNIAGHAVCDGGMTIDLSEMRSVEVDPVDRRARVAPGATLADVDAATQAHGLATPLGINSTTGVAGLTLGGGFGWLTRRFGMTVDNLVAAEMVTADGKVVRASHEEHPGLLWGLRGGGGNFGVVTRFEFGLHPVGPEIVSGLVVYPLEKGSRVLRGWRDIADAAPETLAVWSVLRHAPPLPFLPAHAHGRKVVILAFACTSPVSEAQALVDPLLALGTPLGSHVGPTPYAQWQQAFDPLLEPGARNYWKSHNFARLDDAAIDTVVALGDRLPTTECEIFVAHVAGAANRVPADATAYSHRDARYVMNVHGRWRDAAGDVPGVSWAREAFEACKPWAAGGVYANFLTSDEADRVPAAYGTNMQRLQALKRRWDPANVFHHNANVPPGRD